MDLTRFKGCAEAYGADRRRWPAREHALYDRFAGTPEGAAILAEAARTHPLLVALEVAAPEAAPGGGAGGVVVRGDRGGRTRRGAGASQHEEALGERRCGRAPPLLDSGRG